MLYRGGLQIHTTFDPILQAHAEQARSALPATQDGLRRRDRVARHHDRCHPGDGRRRGFKPHVNEVNMALVPRQTGSSIKIFILAAAFQAGAQPNDLIDGTSVCRSDTERPEGALPDQRRRQPSRRTLQR